MPYFKFKGGNRERYIVLAADEAAARMALPPVFDGVNPQCYDYLADFTQYDKTKQFTFVFNSNQNKIDYYVSADTDLLAIAKFNTAFNPGITIRGYRLKKATVNLDLFAGISAFKKIYYIGLHQNGNNSDYTLATQDSDIALVKYYNFNGCRIDYQAVFNGNDFTPIDGANDAYFKFAAKMATNNLELLPVISSSHAIFTPAAASDSTSDYAKALGSKGITATEYTNCYNKEFAHGAYFANRLKQSGVVCRLIEWGSENDVLLQSTKLQSGSGVRPIAAYQTDSNNVPYWNNYYDQNNVLVWPAKNFGMLIYGCAGFMAGVLSVIPNQEFCYDHSEKHYGQSLALSRDGLKLFPNIFKQMTTAAAHDYSDHENGIDQTKTFAPKLKTDTGRFFTKELWPNGIPMAHYNLDRTGFFLQNDPTLNYTLSYTKMMISETGFNVDKAGPTDGTNPLTFFQNYLIPYQNDPRCLGICYFELKNEPISRQNSTNNEKHFGINDYPDLANFLHSYIPPNTQ